ncbi:hypothetical protein OG328_45525 [Streptomyces sp. NBC_01518]
MVAILKAGGDYVPLDPDHPPAAIQAALDVSGSVAAVIASYDYLRHIPNE